MSLKAAYACLNRVKKELEAGHKGKAIDLALRYFSRNFQEPELYYRWGKAFELLGVARKAIESYGLALKLSPDNPRYLRPLGILLYEIGLLEQAFRVFKKLVGLLPADEEIKRYWASLLEELGLKGVSEQIRSAKPKKLPIRYFPPSLGREEIEIFLRLFRGRENAFAEQVLDEKTSLPKLLHYSKPLTPAWVRKHIWGEKTLFFYPLRTDNQVKLVIVSFYISKRQRFQYARQPSFLILKKEKLKDYTLMALKTIKQLGIPVYLEKLNKFEYRLWVFLKGFIHFLLAKRLAKKIIEQLPYPEFGILMEPVLPTKPIGVGWIERPIFLPLGIDKEIKERSLFIDENGKFYPEQIKFIGKVREWEIAEAKQFLTQGKALVMRKEGDERLEKLRKCCPVINMLVKKAEAGRCLEHREKMVLFYTVGFLDTKGRILHDVLYPLPDYKFQKVERLLKAMKRNPMSCIKIRELVPEYTSSVDCNCVFDLSDGRYPSPLLHINPYLVPPEEHRLTLERSSFNYLAKAFINFYQQRENMDRKLRQIERELVGVFSKKGLKEYTVEGVTLKFDGKHLHLHR